MCQHQYEYVAELRKTPYCKKNLKTSSRDKDELINVKIFVCGVCHLVQLFHDKTNNDFYDDYFLPSSWKFQPHLHQQINDFIEKKGTESSYLEIGCNDGLAISLLMDAGAKRIYGIEPSKDMSGRAQKAGFNVLNCYMNKENVNSIYDKFGTHDFIFFLDMYLNT